jgi:NitT/TauT family transport system substrate-binding protein
LLVSFPALKPVAARDDVNEPKYMSLPMVIMTRRVALGAVAAAAAASVGRPALGQTALKFSLDWKFEGTQAPFLVTLDKGYFKAEGLDVTLDTAVSSVVSINRLALGTYDMAFGDINLLIKFRDQHPQNPIQMVFMAYNRPAYAIVSLKSRGVTTPKDLEGKRLGAPLQDSAFAEWPIFANVNHIDQSKVTIINVGFPVREPMLVSGQVDAITGLSFSSYINVAYAGIPRDDIVVLLMANFGVRLYGNGIMVSPKFAAERPESVKGFLRAYLKGLKDTVKDPAAAIDHVLKRNPVAKKPLELERLQIALRDNFLTPEVEADGFGAVDMARLDKAIDQIALGYAFRSAKPKAESIFNPSFLPPQTERRAN